MRIIHIITSLEAGGAQQMLTRIAGYEKNTEQIVVSLMDEGQYGPVLQGMGVETHYLKMRHLFHIGRALFQLSRLLREKRADVVMTWLYHADIVGLFATLLANRSPKRLIWNLRCSEIDFSQYSFGTRVIVKLLSWLSQMPGAIAFNSHAGRAHHASLGYKPKSWVYLPNGLDTKSWRPDLYSRMKVRAELRIADDEILIGLIARVDPQKDHNTFLSAAEAVADQLGNARFVLIGQGTKCLDIPNAIQDRVLALGFQENVSSLIRALDIHVLSSAFGEGFPNVVCEAMASGVPCVVTDVGQSAELVGDAGIVTPSGDPTALGKAIISLASEPVEQRNQRGKNSRNWIVSQFDLSKVYRLYCSAWHEVAHRNPVARAQ